MLIVILCQGVLPDRGVHLPWGPTRWQRSGHSGCARSIVRRVPRGNAQVLI